MDLHKAMGVALDEAAAASGHDDVPVGAVVLRDGKVIARRHNEREKTGDPTAHAEILALRDAAEVAGSWRLDGMVFGAADPKAGACGSLYNVPADPRLNHQVDVVAGVQADEASRLLTRFFARRR